MTTSKNDTPYEKYQSRGPSSLSDTELLAILLRNGNKNENAYELAGRILSISGDEGRIIGLQRLSFEELLSIEGIGKVKAMCIGCIVELSRRMYMQNKKEVLNLNRPETIAEYFMEEVRHLEVENVILLMLDIKCNLIKSEILSTGSVNFALVAVRDIFIKALRVKAGGIVLIHNHPSGDPTPSNNDIAITKKVKSAGELMEIPLFDHIIIGDKKFVSLKQCGYI